MAAAIWLTIPMGLRASMTFGALGMVAGLRTGQAAVEARNFCQLETPLRNKVRHPSVSIGISDRRDASSWRSDLTARGVKKMSTIEPSGAAGASAAADAVGAQFTVPHDPHYEPPATT
jgi:hypothetical protein